MMGDKVTTLLGEVATHDVCEQHLRNLKDVEININNLSNVEQESEHTQRKPSESGDSQLQRSFHRISLQEPTNLEQFIRNMFENMKAKI